MFFSKPFFVWVLLVLPETQDSRYLLVKLKNDLMKSSSAATLDIENIWEQVNAVEPVDQMNDIQQLNTIDVFEPSNETDVIEPSNQTGDVEPYMQIDDVI